MQDSSTGYFFPAKAERMKNFSYEYLLTVIFHVKMSLLEEVELIHNGIHKDSGIYNYCMSCMNASRFILNPTFSKHLKQEMLDQTSGYEKKKVCKIKVKYQPC